MGAKTGALHNAFLRRPVAYCLSCRAEGRWIIFVQPRNLPSDLRSECPVRVAPYGNCSNGLDVDFLQLRVCPFFFGLKLGLHAHRVFHLSPSSNVIGIPVEHYTAYAANAIGAGENFSLHPCLDEGIASEMLGFQREIHSGSCMGRSVRFSDLGSVPFWNVGLSPTLAWLADFGALHLLAWPT